MLLVAEVMLAIDATALAIAVPSLSNDLGASPVQVLWITDGYTATIAGLLISMSVLADRWGRRRMFFGGLLLFGVTSAAIAVAPTAGAVMLLRLLQGASAAAFYPSTLAILRHLYDGDAPARSRAIAVWAAGGTAGTAAGPVFGGWVVDHFWWGLIFAVNVPAVLVVVVLGSRVLPESVRPGAPRADPWTLVLSAVAAVAATAAVKRLFVDVTDPQSWVLVAVAATAGTLFVRGQRRATRPTVDMTLFSNSLFAGGVAVTAIAAFAMTGLAFLLPQYLQLVRLYPATEAGLHLLPLTVTSVAASFAAARVVGRIGLGPGLAAGLAIAAIGVGSLSAIGAGTGYPALGALLAVIGIGEGVAYTIATDAVVSAIEPERAGAAAGIATTAYDLGASLGVAFLGSLLTLVYRQALVVPPGLSTGQQESMHDSLARAADEPLPQSAHSAARHAFVSGFSLVVVVVAVLTLSAAWVAYRYVPRRAEVGS